MPNQSKALISGFAFQAIMSDLGYDIIKRDPHTKCWVFRLRRDAHTEGFRNPVTVAEPNWVGPDGNAAFERDYVIDLLNLIVGNGHGNSITTILAKRRFDS